MNTHENKKDQRKRRSLNPLIFPSIQIKYALIASVVVAGSFATSVYFMCLSEFKLLKIANELGATDRFAPLLHFQLMLDLVLGALATLITFLISIATTHRFFGSSIGILRYFERLKMRGESEPAQPPRPLTQRSYDPFSHLVNFFNSHEIIVRAKKGSLDRNE